MAHPKSKSYKLWLAKHPPSRRRTVALAPKDRELRFVEVRSRKVPR